MTFEPGKMKAADAIVFHFSGFKGHAIRKRETLRFLPPILYRLDNKVSLQGSDRGCCDEDARDHPTGLCGAGWQIISGVLSSDHVHMFVSIPPKLSVSDFVRRTKGRSSHKVQMEFPDLKKRYWGRHFWGRGYFSTTSGAITDDVILQYLENHIVKPTGISR